MLELHRLPAWVAPLTYRALDSGRFARTLAVVALIALVYQPNWLPLLVGTTFIAPPVAGTQANGDAFFDLKRLGAIGNGSADDQTAIATVMATAGALTTVAASGAIVFAPPGWYMVSGQIVVPTLVRLVGAGRSSSAIQATSGHAAGTPLIRLGAGGAFAFGCRCEDIRLDCNNVVNTCVFSSSIQESSGLSRVLVNQYNTRGVDFTDASGLEYATHYMLEDVEIYASNATTNSYGFYCNSQNGGWGRLARVTVNANAPSSANSQTAGVYVVGAGAAQGNLQLHELNVEKHVDGIYVDTNASVTADSVTIVNGTNVVTIVSSAAVVLSNLKRNGGTAVVVNNVITATITDSLLSWYVASGSASGYQVFSSAGPTSTNGNLIGASEPTYLIRSTASAAAASRSALRFIDGNSNGWRIRFAADSAQPPLDFVPINAGVVDASHSMSLDNQCALRIVATSATALGVGRSSPNWALQVDVNTVSAATGIKITGNIAGSGVAVAAISSGAAEALTVDAKGTGTITIGGTSTGNVTLGGGTNLVNFGQATIALGGGAAPTFGTIGGSGPATAAQNSWLKVNISGTASYIPVWR